MKNRFKRILSLFLCTLLLVGAFSSTCLAASKTKGSCGKKAKWSYNRKTKTLTISGKGAIKDTWSKYLGDKKVNVVIKNGITTIKYGAFSSTCIKKLSLPKSLTTIEACSFGGLDADTPSTITIPKKVKKIGDGAFSFCTGTKAFQVEKGNKYFTANNGVLFNKKKTVLIGCPPRKTGTYTIPNGVETIGNGAFSISSLKKLTIPASVKSIKEGAFWWADIEEVLFDGHVPSGLADELSDDEGCYIKSVTFPKKYYDEWDSFQQKVQEENTELEWYYWW